MKSLRAILILLACTLAGSTALRAADADAERAVRRANRARISAEAMDKLDDRQKLSVSDQLSFQIVEDRDTEPRRLQVSDTGEVQLPYIGRWKVADKTCKQAATEIKARLEKEYYHVATVALSVDILTTRSRGKVMISGAVRTQGSVDIPSDEPLTLTKAIFKAGGFDDAFADRKHVKVLRTNPDRTKKEFYPINVQDILEKGKTENDLILQPGDAIYIYRSWIKF
ncbi:MAG: polysaccharide biosynthesis/export family protein [Verrucomicrobia bacterium]|nr:polysaccharide biosynthesis/export family protein [Verrucomicrobiota bacterium]